MKKSSFYESGLKFTCKRCSACCRYDAGFVYLSKNDLEKLTVATGMEKNKFLSAYCKWVTDWNGEKILSLKEKSNKDCILWDAGCTVYDKRPLQCVTFPFWNSILSSSEAWEMAASGCPGMNSGKLHSKQSIEHNLALRAESACLNRKESEI